MQPATRPRSRLGECAAGAATILVMFAAPLAANAASVFIQVETPSVTLAPTPANYAQDFVEATGASGIGLRIKSSDPLGMTVLVRCSDPAPRIALADLLVRTPTRPGIGGRSLSTYSPLTATDQLLRTTGSSLAPFFHVTTDVRIRNLMGYDDALGAGTTSYSNTLVFTVIGE